MSEDKKIVPEHVAIIMDGNRRWAKERNLPTLEGHMRGYDKLKKVPEWFFARGVKYLSFYAFSTENWKRTQDEVNYLMKLFELALTKDFEEMNQKGYRLLVSGRTEELPGNLPDLCQSAIDKTKRNPGGTVNMCINYGGRIELVDAIKKMIKNGLEPDQIHEGIIKKYLYQSDLPDPDIIIRTSGEQRLSNFLLWQSAYSELVFLKKYWPDFEQADAEAVLKEYADRQRRFGV